MHHGLRQKERSGRRRKQEKEKIRNTELNQGRQGDGGR
jgi:hypothetical protein